MRDSRWPLHDRLFTIDQEIEVTHKIHVFGYIGCSGILIKIDIFFFTNISSHRTRQSFSVFCFFLLGRISQIQSGHIVMIITKPSFDITLSVHTDSES